MTDLLLNETSLDGAMVCAIGLEEIESGFKLRLRLFQACRKTEKAPIERKMWTREV
jgi:hypothetical protein